MLSGDGGSKGRSIENTYKKMSPIEHVLLRPGMYVGGTKEVGVEAWTYDASEAEERKKRLLAQKEARDKAECTFRPVTNEAPRKELIEALLAEDDELAPFTPGSGVGRSPY